MNNRALGSKVHDKHRNSRVVIIGNNNRIQDYSRILYSLPEIKYANKL